MAVVPQACIDANLVLAWLLPSQASRQAEIAREQLQRERFALAGPPLLYVEVPSVIRSHVHQKRLDEDMAEEAFSTFCDLGIDRVEHPELHLRAWRIATDLGMAKAYDAQYLAAADLLECELWTMDQRLIRSVGRRFHRLRPIG